MKSYTITVNGTAYEVTVEETGSVSAPAAAPAAAPKAAPASSTKSSSSCSRRRLSKSNCFRTRQSCQSSSKRWTGSKSRRQRSYS